MNLNCWDIREVDRARALRLSKECGIKPLAAALLMGRGMDTPESIGEFLSPGEFSEPFNMKDMDRVCSRILRAVEGREHIAVYGDYDADGLTSTAMLYTYLRERGAKVSYYIPNREAEGYGMNTGAVDRLKAMGVKLIVTVDNGVSAIEETAYAKSLGIDVAVTDHHQPHETLPDAPVVDPHRRDDTSGLTCLCGAGVTLKLLMALEGAVEPVIERYIDLAALGTVGDSVDLTGENRLIVGLGLKAMERGARPGLRALLGDGPADSGKLAFSVIPCLNSPGRIGDTDMSVRLLTATDEGEAAALAERLRGENQRRKDMTSEVAEAALRVLRDRPELQWDRVLTVWGEGWHQGLVGLAAARLSEMYGKPCFVFSITGGEARGSGRSMEGFDMFRAVTDCSELLTRFGGHAMAAGLSMARENLEEFRLRINQYARVSCPEMPLPVKRLDCALKPGALSLSLLEGLSPLEPFGAGNPRPAFAIMGASLADVRGFGGGKHCELTCKSGGSVFRCKLFRTAPEDVPYPVGSVIDLAAALEENSYRGSVSLSVQVQDMRLSGLDRERCLGDYRLYEKFMRREPMSPEEAGRLRPTRDMLAKLYPLLPRAKGPRLSAEALVMGLEGEGFNLGMLFFGLDVLMERGLIEYSVHGNMIAAGKLPVREKRDVTLSPLYGELSELEEKYAQEKE